MKLFGVFLMLFAAICAEQKVVVVGAGLAGLTTAYRLQQKGFDSHVYEARGRVGGRVLSAKIGGHIGEFGGQNIGDGGEAENLRRLIDECGLSLNVNPIVLKHCYFDGQQFFPVDEFNCSKLRLYEIAKRSSNMREVLDELFPKKGTLYKTLCVRLAGYEGATVDKLSSIYFETLSYMLEGGLSSAHQEKTIDLITVEGGNSLLPEKLAAALEDRIHLNRPLVSVSKDSSGYALAFQNGETTRADILVLAIPCSMYENIAFEEGIIPKERLKAIRNVQYGTNAKILLPFSIPPNERISFLNDMTIGFFDARCDVMTLYYTGDASRFDAGNIQETFAKDCPMIGMVPSIPQLARDELFASYEGAAGYSWSNDPYVKGSYSYIAPGQEKLLTDLQEVEGEKIKTLFAPIDGRLYFAGEHASVLMDVPGTMETACESGERAARMIISSSQGKNFCRAVDK